MADLCCGVLISAHGVSGSVPNDTHEPERTSVSPNEVTPAGKTPAMHVSFSCSHGQTSRASGPVDRRRPSGACPTFIQINSTMTAAGTNQPPSSGSSGLGNDDDSITPREGSGTPQRGFTLSAVPPPASHPPITVALVDDYDVVLLGVAQMLDPYRDRVVIAELDANELRRRTSSTSCCTTPSHNRSPTTRRSAS